MAVEIRRADNKDAAELVAAVHLSLAELQRWMPWATEDYDESTVHSWIAGEFGDVTPFVIVTEGDIVGTTGLNAVDSQNKRANLGYWVRSDLTGRGIATAAAKKVAAHGFTDLGLHRLEILMSVHNAPSRRVAEAVGGTYEGIARDRLFLNDEFHNAHMFSLLPGDVT